MSKRISMVGSGYVGLVSGTCLADTGLQVVCVDNNESKIERLRRGQVPIYEPGLDLLVQKNQVNGNLRFTTDMRQATEEADVIFIAVGTPPGEDGSADLQYVEAAAREIARYMNGYKVVVNKSTVPVGTGRLVHRILAENPGGHPFDVVSNPEFLREGAAIGDFMNPDRVVIGTNSERAAALMRQVYASFEAKGHPLFFTDRETAETIKYASNAFLAMKVTFINEMAALCEQVGANVVDVARGMGLDHRIGQQFLRPGPGYGGSCFPKDTQALAHIGQQYGVRMSLVEATIAANEQQKLRVVERVVAELGELSGQVIAVLGLAFKPDTDDMRDAPALTIIPELIRLGAVVRAFDPQAMDEALWRLEKSSDLVFSNSEAEAVAGADALLILTEWEQFSRLDWDQICKSMKKPRMFDFRNMLDPVRMRESGFEYYSVGRR
ncbi:MAG: UDP-glucose dehydrogenase family protein [Solirubrobacterales bacterium]